MYCNTGSESDFQVLELKNISVKGRIILIRGYGGSVSTEVLSTSLLSAWLLYY